MSQLPNEDRPFARRAVRALAWLLMLQGAVYATAIVYQFVYQWSVNGLTPFILIPRNFNWHNLGTALLQLSGLGEYISMGFQIAGSIGILKFKRWSRHVLIIWAIIAIVSAFLSNMGGWWSYMERYPTTSTQSPSTMMLVFSYTFSFICVSILPAFTIWLMFQPEVKRLWTHQGTGGFDVIPMARIASPTDESSSKG